MKPLKACTMDTAQCMKCHNRLHLTHETLRGVLAMPPIQTIEEILLEFGGYPWRFPKILGVSQN